jgi:hypothetical protein
MGIGPWDAAVGLTYSGGGGMYAREDSILGITGGAGGGAGTGAGAGAGAGGGAGRVTLTARLLKSGVITYSSILY